MNMKVIIRVGLASVAAAGLFAAVVSIQLYNTMKEDKVARDMAIDQWLVINPGSIGVVNSYRALCEGGPSALRSGKSQPLTFAECSAQAGSASLALAIEQASATVVAPAPLRWL